MGGGGYFNGKQPGWAGLGAKHGFASESTSAGSPWFLQIAGNVPGLRIAGVMWAEEPTAFLLGFGSAQSIVDRRLFYF